MASGDGVKFTGPIPDLTPAEIARFYNKLRIAGCGLRWAGSNLNRAGYGRFEIYRQGKRVRILAHRLAYKLFTGEDPGPDVVLRHGCDTPLCCTLDCLTPGTFLENTRDAVERGRLIHPRQRAIAADRLATGKKPCTRCGEVKPLEAFSRSSRNLDGRASHCRSCDVAVKAATREKGQR